MTFHAIVLVLRALPGARTHTQKAWRWLNPSLITIGWMLTRLIARGEVVAKSENEYEYRDAEYEYDGVDKPEPARGDGISPA